jgi:hypothetical protein
LTEEVTRLFYIQEVVGSDFLQDDDYPLGKFLDYIERGYILGRIFATLRNKSIPFYTCKLALHICCVL